MPVVSVRGNGERPGEAGKVAGNITALVAEAKLIAVVPYGGAASLGHDTTAERHARFQLVADNTTVPLQVIGERAVVRHLSAVQWDAQLTHQSCLQLGDAQDLWDLVDAMGQHFALLDDGDQHVRRRCDPSLRHHRVFAAEDRLGAQMLLDLLEEPLDLPAQPAQLAYGLRRQGSIACEEDDALAVIFLERRSARSSTSESLEDIGSLLSLTGETCTR